MQELMQMHCLTEIHFILYIEAGGNHGISADRSILNNMCTVRGHLGQCLAVQPR